MGVSLVLHPRNPYVPTTHANFRFFSTNAADGTPVWWFGGGFDLTPYYPFHDDVLHWHRKAREACEPFGDGLYEKYKKWCDEYFYLKHRDETRGVGGLFFDDLNDMKNLLPSHNRSATSSCPPICRSSKPAAGTSTASASANSSCIVADAMSSSILSTTAAPYSACNRAVAPSRS